MNRFKSQLLPLLAVMAAASTAIHAAEDPPAVARADAAAKPALRALIAQAATEGEVSYWDSVINSNTNNLLTAAFRRYYGLPASFKVGYSVATSSNIITRVDQELSSNRVTMDVVAMGSMTWAYEKLRANQIMRYESPEYAAYKGAFDKGLGKDGYFAFNGAYFFAPMWSGDKLDFKGTSWKDVLGAVPNGRLSVSDAGKSQTYLATYMGLKPVLGDDFLKRIAQMKPTFAVKSELVASQLVTGQMQMALLGMPTRAYQLNQSGAKLKFMTPKEGVVLITQAMFILAKAPHPASGKLWLDFMLSEDGQKIMAENEAMMSGRSGFKSPLPDYAPPLDGLNVIKVDWEKVTAADMEKARTEWLAVFGQ